MEELSITFHRRYRQSLHRAIVEFAQVSVDPGRKYTVKQLQNGLSGSLKTVSCRVEDFWPDQRRPDRLTLINDTYEFDPETGVIMATEGTFVQDSAIDPGAILHRDTAVLNSHINQGVEIGSSSTILNSRVGSLSLIGADCAVDHTHIEPSTVLEAGSILVGSIAPPLQQRDYGELRIESAHWDHGIFTP